MKPLTRNLLYALLGFLCVALLVEGVGLRLPGFLKMLSAVSVSTPLSPSVGSAASSAGTATSSAVVTDKACTASSAIQMSFNSTPIAEGNTIWFNSAIRVDGGLGSEAATIFLTDSMITFAANGSSYSLAVPAAAITFDPGATAASTSFDAANNRWATVVPTANASMAFLSGLAFPVPAGGLPGGIRSVTWSGAFSTDTPGVTARWGWGAAVYTSFASDYNALGIEPVDKGPAGQGARMLSARTETPGEKGDRFVSAGKPASLEAFVIGGAVSDGGSDFTGSYGTVSDVTPCAAGAFARRNTSRTTITLAVRSNAGILLFLGIAATKSCPPSVTGGASLQCSYTLQNLDPFDSVTGLTVSNTIPDPFVPPGSECLGEVTGTTSLPCLQPPGTGVPVTTLGTVGSPTDTCGNFIDETAPPCSAAGCNFTDRVFATGIAGGVSASASVGGVVLVLACPPPTPTNTPTNTPSNTPTNTPTPVLGNQGCGPGFWKQQPHFQFWGCGYTPTALVSTTGLLTNTCGCDYSSLTMLQALSLSSGNTLCEAQGKLYQMAVSALLNACGVQFPLSTPQIIAEVNAALSSCDRETILSEASRLAGFNSLGCPLGGRP